MDSDVYDRALQEAFNTSSHVFIESINSSNVLDELFSAKLITIVEYGDIQAKRTNTKKMEVLVHLIEKKKAQVIEKCLKIFENPRGGGGCPEEVQRVRIRCAMNTVHSELYDSAIELIRPVIARFLNDLPREEQRRILQMTFVERRVEVLHGVVPKNQKNFFSFLNALEGEAKLRGLVDKLEERSKIDMYGNMADKKVMEYCFAQCDVTEVEHARTGAVYFRIECSLLSTSESLLPFTDKEAAKVVNELLETQRNLEKTCQNYIKKVSLQGQMLTILIERLEGEAHVKDCISEIANAIKEIHDARAFHENVKPRNVVTQALERSQSTQESETSRGRDPTICYPMAKDPCGQVLILNVDDVKHMGRRPGSEQDKDSLIELFKRFHLNCFCSQTPKSLKNPTAESIRNVVQEFCQFDHANLQCAVVVVMSHGNDGVIYGSDNQTVEIHNDIINPIAQCSTLASSPKMFIFQFCREGRPMPPTEPMESEVIIAQSTLTGAPSYRDPDSGAIFIRELVKVFKADAERDDVEKLLKTVIVEVKKQSEQVPTICHTLSKSLYFNRSVGS